MSCIVEKGEALSFKESRQNQAVKSGVGPPASNFPPGFAPLPVPSRQGRRVLPLPLAASLRTPPVLRPRHALCHPARRSREIPERFLLRSQPLYSIPPPAAPLRRSSGKQKKKQPARREKGIARGCPTPGPLEQHPYTWGRFSGAAVLRCEVFNSSSRAPKPTRSRSHENPCAAQGDVIPSPLPKSSPLLNGLGLFRPF